MSVHQEILESLTAQVRAAIHGRNTLQTSQVRIIGLTEIKRGAGEQWSALAARVRACSEDFIERRLDRDDILIPAGDGFLIIYDSPDDAGLKAETLQRELNLFYLGEEAMQGISAQVTARQLTAGHILEVLDAAPARPGRSSADGELSAGRFRANAAAQTDLAILPVWSAPQEMIIGYWITPVRGPASSRVYGYDPRWRIAGVQAAGDFLALDLTILDRAVAAIERGLDGRRPSLISYSVHAGTMQNRARRQAFLQQLYAVPEHIRSNLLGRIAEITPGTPRATVSDWVHQLRPVSQRVTIELHAMEGSIEGWKNVGAAAIAYVVPSLPPTAPGLRACARVIKTWSPVLRREGLMFRVDNLDSPALLACAVEHGVDRCTSGRLWPAVPEPAGIRPYSLADFHAALGLN